VWGNEAARTHNKPMQPASHHYSHTCTASIHNQHSHYKNACGSYDT